MLPISLEFFPPKTPEGAEKLRAARQKLYALKPEHRDLETVFAEVNQVEPAKEAAHG